MNQLEKVEVFIFGYIYIYTYGGFTKQSLAKSDALSNHGQFEGRFWNSYARLRTQFCVGMSCPTNPIEILRGDQVGKLVKVWVSGTCGYNQMGF